MRVPTPSPGSAALAAAGGDPCGPDDGAAEDLDWATEQLQRAHAQIFRAISRLRSDAAWLRRSRAASRAGRT